MKLEKHVCSLELAKQLKWAGVKQKSLFYWIAGIEIDEYPDGSHYNSWFADGSIGLYERSQAEEVINIKDSGGWDEEDIKAVDYFSAFTVTELGDMLPAWLNLVGFIQPPTLTIDKGDQRWGVYYEVGKKDEILYYQESDKEVDARARMLIYLISKNIIELK